jgi:hypothetical protein
VVEENVGSVILSEVQRQRKELSNALRRRARAAEAMAKADRDIHAVTGAIMALESIYRRLDSGEEAGAEKPPAPAPVQQYNTLAGPASLFNEVEPAAPNSSGFR